MIFIKDLCSFSKEHRILTLHNFLVQTSVTKTHRLGSLKTRKSISHSYEGCKSNIKGATKVKFWQEPSFRLHANSLITFSHGREREA